MRLAELKKLEDKDKLLRQLMITISKVFRGTFHKDGEDFVGEGVDGGIRISPYMDHAFTPPQPWAQIDCDNLLKSKHKIAAAVADDGWKYDPASHHPDNPYIHVDLTGQKVSEAKEPKYDSSSLVFRQVVLGLTKHVPARFEPYENDSEDLLARLAPDDDEYIRVANIGRGRSSDIWRTTLIRLVFNKKSKWPDEIVKYIEDNFKVVRTSLDSEVHPDKERYVDDYEVTTRP